MNSGDTTDNVAAEPASRSALPLSRVVLIVILVGLIAGLYWDLSQRKVVAKAETAINDLIEEDIKTTTAYLKDKNRQMPNEERAIKQAAIRKLVKETYSREAEAGSTHFGSVDNFVWSGFFYRYVLAVEYTSYQKAAADEDGEAVTVLIASRASWESKMRFSK